MTPAPLLGITGRAGAGKDTVARILAARHQYSIYAFATPLYEMVRAGFGIDVHQLTRAQKETPIDWLGDRSPRHLLQTLGTEWGRTCVAADVWIRAAERNIDQHRAHFGPRARVVITDVRFPNEAEWVRARGGLIWHLTRPDDGLDGDAGAHASERGVPYAISDCWLRNDGTLDELERAVTHLVHQPPGSGTHAAPRH